ncbi:MAG TPA: hypothetical protein PLH57_01175 [Oligoflexia bacterium]|nr:hypothetical protein [Oligoflexia bacterium]
MKRKNFHSLFAFVGLFYGSVVWAGPFSFIFQPYSVGIELDGEFQGASPNPGQGYFPVPGLTNRQGGATYFGPLASFCVDGTTKAKKVPAVIEYFVKPQIIPSGGGTPENTVYDLVISYGVRAWKVQKSLEKPYLHDWALKDAVLGKGVLAECGGRFVATVRYGVQAIGTYRLRIVGDVDSIAARVEDLRFKHVDETGLASSKGRLDVLKELQDKIDQIEPRIEEIGDDLNFLVRSWRETSLPHLYEIRSGDVDLRLSDELEFFIGSYISGDEVWGDPVSAVVNSYREILPLNSR